MILPFPGGMVRSGSKVGSKYKALIASTNDAYCPTLKGQTATKLPPDAAAVLEIVIDGLTEASVREATRAGIAAACTVGASGGMLKIDAGNYGGKLGKYRIPVAGDHGMSGLTFRLKSRAALARSTCRR